MKKNIQSVSETYICPKKAGYKFRSARKFHTPLYLYGVTGIGKTALILNNVNMKKCSYYSATSILADEINIEKKTTEHTVVIDDLQSLADSSQKEAYFEKIKAGDVSLNDSVIGYLTEGNRYAKSIPESQKMAVDAISMRDYPIIQAYVMWMAIIYVLVNLLTDLSYRFLDPRIRLGGAKQ